MYIPTQTNLDERISDFITRKTAPKNLSQIIADRLIPEHEPHVSERKARYEFLPIRGRFSGTSRDV